MVFKSGKGVVPATLRYIGVLAFVLVTVALSALVYARQQGSPQAEGSPKTEGSPQKEAPPQTEGSPKKQAVPEQELPKVSDPVQVTSDRLSKDRLFADGTRLYFNQKTKQGWTIAYVPVGTGKASVLTTSVRNPKILDVSSQSELLVSSGTPKGGESTLWIVPFSGGKPRALAIRSSAAAWEPDGKILFAKGKDLYRAQHDGSRPVKVLTFPGVPFEIMVSPDGSHIRYTFGDVHKRTTTWEAQSDGSKAHPILPLPVFKTLPNFVPEDDVAQLCCGRWTPDGKYFLYENAGDLWIASGSGTISPKVNPPTQLTSGPLAFHYPVVSADGRKLFALGSERSTSEAGPREIYVFDLQQLP